MPTIEATEQSPNQIEKVRSCSQLKLNTRYFFVNDTTISIYSEKPAANAMPATIHRNILSRILRALLQTPEPAPTSTETHADTTTNAHQSKQGDSFEITEEKTVEQGQKIIKIKFFNPKAETPKELWTTPKDICPNENSLAIDRRKGPMTPLAPARRDELTDATNPNVKLRTTDPAKETRDLILRAIAEKKKEKAKKTSLPAGDRYLY